MTSDSSAPERARLPGERRQVSDRLAEAEVVDLLRSAERLLAATGTRIERCANPVMGGERGRG